MYTFPFDTCEKPNVGIAQPYSVAVNCITCSIVFYYLCKTTTIHSFLLLGSLFVFELFHTLSHFIHIKGPFLVTSTHIAGFLFNLSFLYYLYKDTNVSPGNYSLVFGIILMADYYAFTNLSFIYFILTQIFFFLSILFYYYPLLSKEKRYNLNIILVSTFFIYLAFVNEKMNCKKMLDAFSFPFHMIIELLSIVPIYVLSKTFY